jgi:hypothetical protein
MSKKRELRGFLSGLRERAAAQFRKVAVQYKAWWEIDDAVCAVHKQCWAEIFDEMGTRFPLDLVIPGVPDNRHFKLVGRISIGAAGTPTELEEIIFRAPDNRFLVISNIDLAPDNIDPFTPGVLGIDIQGILRNHEESWRYLHDRNQIGNFGVGFPNSRTHMIYNRLVLTDDDQYILRFINLDVVDHFVDVEVEGWLK